MTETVSASELRQLHLALDPPQAYAMLHELAPNWFGAAVHGAYLVRDDGGFVLDADAGPSDAPRTWHARRDPLPESFQGVPFDYVGRPLGAVVFDGADAVDGPAVRRELERHFAPALFRALWVADTLDANAAMRRQVEFLQAMGRLLGELDLEPLLLNILDLTCSFLGAELGSVVLIDDGGTPDLAVDFGLPLAELGALRVRDGTPVLELAIATDAPLILDGDALHPDATRRPEGLILLPLHTREGVVGCLALASGARAARVDEAALDTIRPALGLAATAIENARLVAIKIVREKEQQQLQLGRRIQARLLPSAPPPVPGLELAASSVPARIIGGDYFDYLTLRDGALGLLVADVAGKGVAAGLIMTAARATFRSVAREYDDPAEILSGVNRTLAAEDFGGRFVTAIMVRVDLAARQVTVCTAGHEPLLVRRDATGIVESYGTPALPLGILEDAEYASRSASIFSGDVLALYTDGVTEAIGPGRELYGRDRLIALLGRPADGAEAIRDRILRSVAAHLGPNPRNDDTTLITARIR